MSLTLNLSRRMLLGRSVATIAAVLPASLQAASVEKAAADLPENDRLLVLGEQSGGVAVPVPAPVDPIFAAIQRHREALLAYRAATEAYDEQPYQGLEDEELALGKVNDAEFERLSELGALRPTSLAGIHAVLTYMIEQSERDVFGYLEVRDFLGTIRDAVAAHV
jgi:hypothetical protein